MLAEVNINNLPEHTDKYVVARYVPETNGLWFWGYWKDKKGAERCAQEIGGIVFERSEGESE